MQAVEKALLARAPVHIQFDCAHPDNVVLLKTVRDNELILNYNNWDESSFWLNLLENSWKGITQSEK